MQLNIHMIEKIENRTNKGSINAWTPNSQATLDTEHEVIYKEEAMEL